MLNITCPKCGELIKIGKDEYNTLLNEIEKSEIDTQVKTRVEEIKKGLEAKSELELNKIQAQQTQKINELETQNKLLQEKLSNVDKDNKKDIELAVSKAKEPFRDELEKANKQIQDLQNALASQVEITKKVEEDRDSWKNYRLGGSTKALGESLEQYCHDEFNKIRAMTYPHAYFEKDNEVDENGKGDFIFKDYQDGIETVSIMFEMKNQNDTTKTKNKNENFFKKLDENRTSKNCEYAVLVSTLEEDSDLYNAGIVDVSYKYPKMFVVRPQFFIPIINLISKLAKDAFEYKKQVDIYRKENIDITNFESTVETIMGKICSDYEKANEIYSNVDKMCDDFVKRIENFRKEYKTAAGWIEKAKNQLPNLEIRKLTYGNPTMTEKFGALKQEGNDGE